MNILRTIEKTIKSQCFKGKIVIIYGPRQVGKTTLSKKIMGDFGGGLYLTCDDATTQSELTNKNTQQLLDLVKGYKIVVIDEAQRVKNIGITLKQLVDALPKEVQIIATGSSSFDLANKINEPLTGRSFEFKLYPFSLQELSQSEDYITQRSTIDDKIVYGLYPDVVFGQEDRKRILYNLTEQYLYKDILTFEGVRKPEIIKKVLKLLAASVGNLVSYSEIANTLDVSKKTVESYISILEQAFIVYALLPFSNNIRSELTKKRKIFFVDTGILNILLEDLSPIDTLSRTNKGALWENFVINERIKFLNNNDYFMTKYNFWRTTAGQEIDYIEKTQQKITGVEIKWKSHENIKIPQLWRDSYSGSSFKVINKDNFFDTIYFEA